MKLLNILTKISVWVGGLMIIGVVLLTVGDVIARKFFASGYYGLTDVTQLGVIGFVYLAMPRAFLTQAHVAVELYDEKLSYRGDLLLKNFALLLSIAVLSLLLWYGWIQANRSLRYGDVSQNIAIPITIYWCFLFIGVALGWLVCVTQFVVNFLKCYRGGADV